MHSSERSSAGSRFESFEEAIPDNRGLNHSGIRAELFREVIMSEAITEVRPHNQMLLIAVLKRALDSLAAQTLIDDVLAAAGETPRLPIVLDMSLVRFAPSIALGALVQLSKGFKLDGRKLALIHVDRQVLSSIHVTNLHAILEIHDSLEQAIGRPK